MRIKHFSTSLLAVILLLSSCSTPKNITYFQDLGNESIIQAEQQLDIRVKPEDKLMIMVTTQDPALSSLFNLLQVQNRLSATTTTTSSVGTSINNGNLQISYYTVDSYGDITFPVIGKLHIGGMRRDEVSNYIAERLINDDLVKDPIVTVEFANTGISIIGEVTAPGRYEFNKDRLSILDALAMARDLTPNGMRENVTVIRETEKGKQQAYRIDLTDMSSITSSPVYYLQQNDVIYVEPNDKKKRETTPNGNTPYTPSFWVSMGSFGVTIATLIVTISNK